LDFVQNRQNTEKWDMVGLGAIENITGHTLFYFSAKVSTFICILIICIGSFGVGQWGKSDLKMRKVSL
jgi:hypothetical protein